MNHLHAQPSTASLFAPAASGNEEDATHTASGDDASLLELLSERLLAEFSVAAWRNVLLGKGYGRVRFQDQAAALLCFDPSQLDWDAADLQSLAERFAGRLESFGSNPVLAFREARSALQAAMLLHRTSGQRVRVAVLTAIVTTASFELFGTPRSLVLSARLQDVAALMRRSLPGSIKLCPETYRELAGGIERHARGAVVTTEYCGDEVISALITPLPPPRSEYSTFAGLGLT